MTNKDTSGQDILKAVRCAFPYTIPIFTGFWFLGLTYGIYMKVSGFSFVYPTLMAAIMIQARHLFYGIAMLEKFKGTGGKKWYLIFGM